MELFLVLQVQELSAAITCTAENCSSTKFQINTTVSPVCENFVASNRSASADLTLGVTFFCQCVYLGVSTFFECNLTFAGKYFFNISSTNLTVATYEAEISIKLTVSNMPYMLRYCGAFDYGYSATWTNAGGCKPTRSVNGTAVYYSSCFGVEVPFDSGVNQKIPKFKVTVADIYIDVLAQVVIPIAISNANIVSVYINSAPVSFTQTASTITIEKLALGKYQPLIIYRDECQTTYVYDETLTVYSLTFRHFDITQNVDCSGPNCIFKSTFANISLFSTNICPYIYFQSPAAYNFSTPGACSQTGDSVYITFLNDFTIFNGAVVAMSFDAISRIVLSQQLYLASFSITLQAVPSDTQLIINNYCINKAYESVDSGQIVQNSTYRDQIASVQKPYGCVRVPVMKKEPEPPVKYTVSYASCFGYNFTRVIEEAELQAIVLQSGQPYLVEGNNFSLLVNISGLLQSFNFSNITSFYLTSAADVILASNFEFVAADSLLLHFQLSETYGAGTYRLSFPYPSFCGGEFDIQLLIGGQELQLYKAMLFRPVTVQGYSYQFDISTYNGSSTGLSFTGVCTIDAFLQKMAPYIYRQSCAFDYATVSVNLSDYYVSSNSSALARFAVVNSTFIAGSAGSVVLLQFSDALYSYARRSMEQAVLCSAERRVYYVPDYAATFYQVSAEFNQTAKSVSLTATSRFDQQLQTTRNETPHNVTFIPQQTGPMTCSTTYCPDNAIYADVFSYYARIYRVVLTGGARDVDMLQTNASRWEIRLASPSLLSGTYRVVVHFANLCEEPFELTNGSAFLVYKPLVLRFDRNLSLTYAQLGFVLQGDTNIRVNGTLMASVSAEAPSLASYTARYQCTFSDAAGVAYKIGVTSVISADFVKSTLGVDFNVDPNYADYDNAMQAAPGNIRALCAGTRFTIEFLAALYDVGQNVTFEVQDVPAVVCSISSGLVSREQTTFVNKLTTCGAVSPFYVTNNGKSAADVQTSNTISARLENTQVFTGTLYTNQSLSNLTASRREFMTLPAFVKTEVSRHFTMADVRAVLAPYFLRRSGDGAAQLAGFFPLKYEVAQLLKQANQTALEHYFKDLSSSAHALGPAVGVVSEAFLAELAKIEAMGADLGQFYVKMAYNAQLQEGLLVYYKTSRRLTLITAPRDTSSIIQLNVSFGQTSAEVSLNLTSNGMDSMQRQGLHISVFGSQVFGSHQGELGVEIKRLAKCSLDGKQCTTLQTENSTSCVCAASGKFVLLLEAQERNAFPGWAIAVIVIVIVLVLAAVVTIVLLVKNGTLRRRQRRAATRISSAGAVLA